MHAMAPKQAQAPGMALETASTESMVSKYPRPPTSPSLGCLFEHPNPAKIWTTLAVKLAESAVPDMLLANCPLSYDFLAGRGNSRVS